MFSKYKLSSCVVGTKTILVTISVPLLLYSLKIIKKPEAMIKTNEIVLKTNSKGRLKQYAKPKYINGKNTNELNIVTKW